MSSYIVSNKTINKILTYLAFHSENLEDYHIKQFKKKLKIKEYDEKWETKLGRKLLKMNIDATEQRYTDPYLNKEQKKERLDNFKFEKVDCKRIGVLKALHCFTYQCAEGNISERKLYKQLEELETEIANSIVMNSPEYDKEEWG